MTYDGFCSCKTQRTRYSRNLWGHFLVEAEIRSRDHHAPECPMSKLPAATRQTKRVLNFSIPTLQNYYGRASKVSLSYTTGAGILGFGQTVTWITTVDEKSSPVFRMVQMMEIYNRLPRKDMRILLASCLRRLVWCYVNYHASVTDVNKSGDSIIEWALEHYHVSHCYTPCDFLTHHMCYSLAAVWQLWTLIIWQTYFRCFLLSRNLRHIPAGSQCKFIEN